MKIILGKKQQAEEVAEAKESAKAETKAEAGQAEERTSRSEELPPEGLYEEEAKTDEYARVIYMNDRTVRQTISSVPVRYYDEEEKRYKRVETALKRNSRGVLENKKNTFATEFAGETKEGIYRLSRHGCEVELLAQGVAEKSIGTEEGTNTVKISEVKPHVDYEYKVESNRIKENIIIRERTDEYEYAFSIKVKELKVEVSEDGRSLELKNKESGAVEFRIPGPVMSDANGKESDRVYYEIEESDGETLAIKVIADAEYMNAEQRAYPITIDPQITITDDERIAAYMQHLEGGYCTDSFGNCNAPSSGTEPSCHWNTSAEPSSTLRIYRNENGVTRAKIEIRKTKIELQDKRIIGVELSFQGGYVYTEGNIKLDNGTWVYANAAMINYGYDRNISFDITEQFMQEEGDFEVYLQTATEVDVELRGGATLKIDYLQNEDIKPVKRTYTIAGGAEGEYNVTTGEMVTQIKDTVGQNTQLEYPIRHIYKKSSETHNCGKNFRLNLHEKLEKKKATETLDADYIYTDAIGDKYGFEDRYYYLDTSNARVYVDDKSNIEIDLEGNLKYTASDGTEYKIYKEQRTLSGLTAITEIPNFINHELIDQRNENLIEAEEKLKQLKKQKFSYDQLILQSEIQELSYKLQDAQNQMNKYPKEENYENFENTYKKFLKKSEEFAKAETEYFFANYPGGDEETWGMSSVLNNRDEYLDVTTINNAESFKAARNYFFDEHDVFKRDTAKDNSTVAKAFNYHYANLMNAAKNKMQEISDGAKNLRYEDKAIQDFLMETQEKIVEKQKKMLEDPDKIILGNFVVHQTESDKIDIINKIKIAEYEYQKLLKQMPLNYLTDGTIVKGFNEAGDLVAIFDKHDNVATIEYDDDNKIIGMYFGETEKIDFEYNQAKNLISITDTRGRETKYKYDEEGYLTEIKYANGKEMKLAYLNENIREITAKREGEYTKYEYGNSLERISNKSTVSKIAPEGATEIASAGSYKTIGDIQITKGTYDTKIEEEGRTTYYKFSETSGLAGYYEEENGKVVKAEKYDYEAYSHDYVYYAKKDSLYSKAYSSFTDSDFNGGDWEKRELDNFNNPTKSETNARTLTANSTEQVTTEYEYNEDHKCVKESAKVTLTLPSGTKKYERITKYSYNAQGNMVRTESYTHRLNPTTGAVIEDESISRGREIEETVYDENGNAVKSFSYNSLDSSSKFYTESEVAENGQTLADYDETGENKTEYEYISGTNVVRSQKLPNGSKFAYGHDENDTVTSITQSTEEGEENSTHKRYTCGEVTELVSGNNIVRYAYDAKRRVTQVYLNDLENAYIQNTYTDNKTLNGVKVDQCVSKNAKNESVTSYTDKQGKVRRITTSSGKNIDYAYNAKGETISVVDGVSGKTENYTYDDTYDRLTSYARGTEYAETYAYDEYGKVSSVTESGAATRTYTYAYKDNAARELESITTGSYKFSPQTDKLGRGAGREVWKDNAKLAGEYIYYRKVGDHATNKPSSVYFGKKSGDNFPITESIKYAYDSMGNISRIDENGEPVVWYKYDALNRLVREDNKTFGKTWLYSYDNKGNILSKRETSFTLKENAEESGFTRVQYEYDGDKLLTFGTESCEYDAIGNPTTYRGKSASWSNGRQMKSYDGTAFTYDGLGRRLSKGNITYTYDSNNRIIKQSNGIEFIYDNSGVAGIVYNNATYVYRKDGQGNIAALIDSSGNVVVEYKYDAWGDHVIVLSDSSNENLAKANPFRYRGYYYDEETGLYYLKSRYYDPETGRFLNADDISYLDPETINGLNLYAYCGNNPVMNEDPNGTFFLSFLIGLGIAALTFAVVNTGTQLVGDLINYAATGSWNSGWEDYLGAFVGGLAGGAVFFLTHGNLAATFAIMGGVETLTTNLLTNATGRTNHSAWQILSNTSFSIVVGIITGTMGGTKWNGITAGRNSYLSVWKGGLTRLRNNTGYMHSKTILKGLLSIAIMRITAGISSGLISSATEWIRWFFGEQSNLGYL